MNKLGMETRCIQAGYTPGNGEPRQIPIIQSTTFKYATSEEMGKLFDLEVQYSALSGLSGSYMQPVHSTISPSGRR